MHHRGPVFALLAATGWLLLPGTALADCQPASSIEEALDASEVAFVGTAIAVAEGQPGAGFKVEEVWVGTVGETVEVQGMDEGGGLLEDDRLWRAGVRYLVIPYIEGGTLRDNICTATTEWQPELAVLRPPGATGAESPAEESGGFPVIPIIVFVIVALGLAAFAIGPRLSDSRRSR